MQKIIILALIITAIIVYIKSRKRSIDHPRPAPIQYQYHKVSSLFTPEEQHFLIALETAVQSLPLRLYAKVSLASLITVDTAQRHHPHEPDLYPPATRHIDFVLVHPSSFSPLLVIELDYETHRRKNWHKRDPIILQALEQAGIPVLHIPIKSKYSDTLLRDLIKNYMD